MTSKSSTKDVRTKNKCVVCEVDSLTDKQYVEHCSSLMHHLKCEQLSKGKKHICNLCKTSCKTVKEYGKHLSSSVHTSARDKFCAALAKGKTVESLIKTNAILKPDVSIPVKPSENKGHYSRKLDARDTGKKDNYRSCENFQPNSNYKNFSWHQGPHNQSSYQGYNSFDNSGQYHNYFRSDFYKDMPWNGNVWNQPYDGNWQWSNYHMDNFPAKEYGHNDQHFFFDNERHHGNIVTEECLSRSNEETGKRNVRSEKKLEKSSSKTTIQNVTKETSNYGLRKRKPSSSNVSEKDADPKLTESFNVCESSKVYESSVDNKSMPSVSSKVCTTPTCKPKLSTKSIMLPLDGPSPPKTPQSQTELSARDLTKDLVKKLVDQKCSRKCKLLLENFMNKRERTQSTVDSRLEQNLLSLVQEAMAADVAKALSAENLADSPSDDSLQQVKMSVLSDEILEQIVELLKFRKSDSSCSDVRSENALNDKRINTRGVIDGLNVDIEDVEVIDVNSELPSSSVVELSTEEEYNENIDDRCAVKVRKTKTNKCNVASAKLKQKKAKKANSKSNSVGDLVETLQLLSSKLEAGISRLGGGSSSCLLEKTETLVNLAQSPEPKLLSKAKLKETKRKKTKLKSGSNSDNMVGIIPISKKKKRNATTTKNSPLAVHNEQSAGLLDDAIASAANQKSSDLNGGEQSKCHEMSKEATAAPVDDLSIKREKPDVSEHVLEASNLSGEQQNYSIPPGRSGFEIKAEVSDPAFTESTEAPENPDQSATVDFIKKEVVEEIICEGEEMLKNNEMDLTIPQDITAECHSFGSVNREDLLGSSDSPTISSLGASSIAVQALDYAIEEESLETQIQLLQKQITKLQLVISKLEEKKQFVRQERSKIMVGLKATVEGRKQAASLNRIIAELPTDPFHVQSDIPTSFSQVVDGSLDSAYAPLHGGDVSGSRLSVSLNTSNGDNSLPLNSLNGSTVNALPSSSSCSGSNENFDVPPNRKGEKRKNSQSNENLEKQPSNGKGKKKAKVTVQSLDQSSVVLDEKRAKLSTSVKSAQKQKKKKKKGKGKPGVKIVAKTMLNFYGHVDSVVQLTTNAEKLYSCSTDGTVRKFKIKSKSEEQKCLSTFTHKSHSVVAMEVITGAGDDIDDCIITASRNGVLKKFDLLNGDFVGMIDCKEPIRCIVSHWSYLFVGFTSGLVSHYGIKNFKVMNSYVCSNCPITCMTTAVEGACRLLCTGAEERTVSVREAFSGVLIRYYSLEVEYPKKISVVNGVSYTLGFDKRQCRSIYMHQFLTGELLKEIKYTVNITSMCISDDQMVLLLGGGDGLIRVVDLQTLKPKLYYGSGYKTVTSLCVYKNLLISSNEDGKIEACKMLPHQTYVCKYGKCPATFAYYEDVSQHVECVHARSMPIQCLAAKCGILFAYPENVKETSAHILSHVQQETQDE